MVNLCSDGGNGKCFFFEKTWFLRDLTIKILQSEISLSFMNFDLILFFYFHIHSFIQSFSLFFSVFPNINFSFYFYFSAYSSSQSEFDLSFFILPFYTSCHHTLLAPCCLYLMLFSSCYSISSHQTTTTSIGNAFFYYYFIAAILTQQPRRQNPGWGHRPTSILNHRLKNDVYILFTQIHGK